MNQFTSIKLTYVAYVAAVAAVAGIFVFLFIVGHRIDMERLDVFVIDNMTSTIHVINTGTKKIMMYELDVMNSTQTSNSTGDVSIEYINTTDVGIIESNLMSNVDVENEVVNETLESINSTNVPVAAIGDKESSNTAGDISVNTTDVGIIQSNVMSNIDVENEVVTETLDSINATNSPDKESSNTTGDDSIEYVNNTDVGIIQSNVMSNVDVENEVVNETLDSINATNNPVTIIEDKESSKTTGDVSIEYVNNTDVGIIQSNEMSNIDVENEVVNEPLESINATNNPVTIIKDKASCMRPCFHRKNIIIYSYHDSTAGLNDREFIINELSNLAGYFCASPILSNPEALLSPNHNDGNRVDSRIQWDDYRGLQWIQDGQNVFNSPGISIPSITDFENNNTKDWLILRVNNDWSNFSNYLLQIEEFILEYLDQGFVVEFTGDWYDSNFRLDYSNWKEFPYGNSTEAVTIRNQKKCNYITAHNPRPMEDIVNMIWSELLELGADRIGYFHIRRTDATNECNTTLSKIEAFLRCSLNDSKRLGKFVILFGSDEQEQEYRHQVQAFIEDNYDYIAVIDIDNMVLTKLNQAKEENGFHLYFKNNYYVFKILEFLKWRCHFQLVQRRMTCPDCSPIY